MGWVESEPSIMGKVSKFSPLIGVTSGGIIFLSAGMLSNQLISGLSGDTGSSPPHDINIAQETDNKKNRYFFMTTSILVQCKDTSSFNIDDDKAYKNTIISFTLKVLQMRAVLI
jgi:hypothetical protein